MSNVEVLYKCNNSLGEGITYSSKNNTLYWLDISNFSKLFRVNLSSNKKDKRWVIYKHRVESSKIPPEWHLWIHYLVKNKPIDNLAKFSWQKNYEENLTGTPRAYKPEGSLSSDSKAKNKKYEIWEK